MAISERLKMFLDGSKVRYAIATHPAVYTAQEIAAAQHVPGRQLAKSVLVKTDRGPVLAVLPAVALIDFKRLKTLLRAKTLSLAKEDGVKRCFPDVEVGAMSPFGNLYQVPVVVDRALEGTEEVVFNAGSHTETVRMRYRDFSALVQPTVGIFGRLLLPPRTRLAKRAASPRRSHPVGSKSKGKSAVRGAGTRKGRSKSKRR